MRRVFNSGVVGARVAIRRASVNAIPSFRKFFGLTQAQFAEAMGISVHTLRNKNTSSPSRWTSDRALPNSGSAPPCHPRESQSAA